MMSETKKDDARGKPRFNVWGASPLSWLEFCISCLMLLAAGNLYAFNSYSDVFKYKFGFGNTQVQTITSVANLGLCFATPAGWIIDRFGSRVASLFGAILGAGGYLLLYVAQAHFRGTFLTHEYSVAFYYVILGQGSIFTYMSGLMRYKLFATIHRGKAVGLLDCMFGLSAFFISLVYKYVFAQVKIEDQKMDIFFIVCAAILLSVNAIAFFLRDPTTAPPYEDERDHILEVVLEDAEEDDHYQIFEEGHAHDGHKRFKTTEKDSSKGPSEDIGGWKVWTRLDYWLFAAIACINFSTALLFINNVGYISTSLQLPRHEDVTTNLALLIPIVGGASRLFCGVVSDLLVKWLSRGAFLTFSSAVGLASFLALWLWSPHGGGDLMMYLVSAAAGLAFGSAWCLIPLMTSERFGSIHFGYNWGNIIVVSAIAYFPFTWVQAAFYNKHLAHSTSKTCYGADCWSETFLVSACFCALSTVLGAVLAYRTKAPRQMM